MQQKMVYAGTSYSMETPLLIAAKQMLNLSNQKTADSYAADQIFHDLWKQGKRPQMTYFKQNEICSVQSTLN